METTREQLLLLITTPVYVIVIGLEMLLSSIHLKKYYTAKGVLYNVYLSALNFSLDLLMLGTCIFILTFFSQYSFVTIQNLWIYWLTLLVAEDFLYYILHYVDHNCRLFWAVHVTHHSSSEYNLTVGFRSSVFQPLYRLFYFIPLAFFGFSPIDIMFMYSATQIYGILIHTQFVGRLGFLEWFMATPSHHRVHHGKNPIYLDKNMGMVLIVWDKLFGTFQKEEDNIKIEYGLTKPLKKENAVTIVFHEWMEMVNDLRKPVRLNIKLKYIFGKPGWSHDGSRKTSAQLRKEYFLGKEIKKKSDLSHL